MKEEPQNADDADYTIPLINAMVFLKTCNNYDWFM